MQRIDTILVQPIITTYNESGQPVHEESVQAMKLFRASQSDVWTLLDELLAKKQAEEVTPAKGA